MGRKPRYPGQAMRIANVYARSTLIDYLISVGLAAGAPQRGALAQGFEIVVSLALAIAAKPHITGETN